MISVVGLALGTLISEDLACVTAALLIQRGELSAAVAVTACALGIVLGDWGLWAAGRLGGEAVYSWSWVARHFPSARAEELRVRLERHAAGAIIASRFLPGTRLPLYITAGVVRMSGIRFALWTLVAAMLWTPGIVLLTAWSGDVASQYLSRSTAVQRVALVVPACLLLVAFHAAHSSRSCATYVVSGFSRTFRARLARWRRWEFWPMWLFYSPVAAWVALLALRYRGLATIMASNPGMADGGIVGESKFEILSKLPADWTIPTAFVGPGDTALRVESVTGHMQRTGWTFPVILKPDVGQRGVGVRLAHRMPDVREYLTRTEGPVIIQPYHDGPFEAGVFYYRMPGWARGRILSITDKHFPVIVGDGRSTIEELIWAHPRYRMQATLFLQRHAAVTNRVLGRGERLQLAIAGNHAQGTLFRDGSHLLTPELERRVDEIARAYPRFFVGRFDVRYRNLEEFKAGRDLAIVELNGATAESTNIYDPDTSLVQAYRQLFRQWAIVFAIGYANRTSGAVVTRTRRLFDLVRAHLTTSVVYVVSD